MPNRLLRDWTDSEAVNSLDARAEVLFLRLIMKADDYGRFTAHPRLIRSQCFPLQDGIRDADISRQLAACEKAGLIRVYQSAEKPFLEIVKFGQRMRATKSKFPSPDDGELQTIDRSLRPEAETRVESRESETESRKKDAEFSLSNWKPIEENQNQETPAKPTVQAARGPRETFPCGPTEMVQRFWTAYPKKTSFGKLKDAMPGAVASIVLETGVTDAEAFRILLDAAEEYRKSPAGQESIGSSDGRPSPALWLSDERWRDDRKAWRVRNGDSGRSAGTRKVSVKPLEERKTADNALGKQMQDMMQ